MRAALDRRDLAHAQARHGGEVFERPILFDAEELDAVAEAFAEAILKSASKAEGLHGVAQRLAELRKRKGLRDVVKNLELEGGAHVLERGIAGDHDDAESGPAGEDLFDHLFAAIRPHLHVEEDDVRELLFVGLVKEGGGLERPDGVESFVFEEIFEILAKVGVIIEDGDVHQGGIVRDEFRRHTHRVQSLAQPMLRTSLIALFLASSLSFALTKQEKKEGFKPLFNGKNLKGWDGDPRLWKVEPQGILVGSTDGVKIEGNTFLITEKEYGDFELRLQIKLRNHNSGVQFRSEKMMPGWVVKGLQADAAEKNWWGSIYDEKGKRGVIVNGWKGKAETVVKDKEWNDMIVYCKGDQIRITINGMVTAELKDSSKLAGIIALQLHRGPDMRAEFRDIRIKELK